MANVYYGDTISPATGNWNTVSNWYSSIGSYSYNCCGCPTANPGTPLGRLPNPSTDTVILASAGDDSGQYSLNITMTTPPTGGYSGPILSLIGDTYGCNFTISTGSFSGSINVGRGCTITAGTFTGVITMGTYTGIGNYYGGGTISGGTFSNTVTMPNLPASTQYLVSLPTISGGTFTGLVVRANPNIYTNKISGGTYSVSQTVTYNTTTKLFTNFPVDPGFAVGGGTFSPIVTISNLPSGGTSILGAGFP